MSPKGVRQGREVRSAGGRKGCIFKWGGQLGRVLKEVKERALQILRGTVFQA